jgi:threonine/homoserine/homoserine lactone efflux protein
VNGEFAAFLVVVVLVVVTPGQDTALTIRNTLAGGRRAGVLSALGVVTGQAVWILATAAGLAAVILSSAPAFLALKIAGAVYLVALGAQALRAAFRGGARNVATSPRTGALPPRVAYRQGLVSNLGNPKIGAFCTGLLPQFVPRHGASFGDFVALGAVLWALTLAWLTLYASVVARAGDLLRRSSVRRALDGVTGGVLVALGVRIALERR